MLITPMPGTNQDNLMKVLRGIHQDASNARSGDMRRKYFEWADRAARQLYRQVSQADIERLVLTKGYERILNVTVGSGAVDDTTTTPIINQLLSTELVQRVAELEEVCGELEAAIRRWGGIGPHLVFDTSVFIEAPQKLDELDFRELFGVDDHGFCLVVPIVVVDELDGLKRSKETDKRRRARQTLAVLDRVAEGIGHDRLPNNVTVEILFDPPGHVRLPINDDEIVDRALAIQLDWHASDHDHVRHPPIDARPGRRLAVKKLVEPPEPAPDAASAPSRRERHR